MSGDLSGAVSREIASAVQQASLDLMLGEALSHDLYLILVAKIEERAYSRLGFLDTAHVASELVESRIQATERYVVEMQSALNLPTSCVDIQRYAIYAADGLIGYISEGYERAVKLNSNGRSYIPGFMEFGEGVFGITARMPEQPDPARYHEAMLDAAESVRKELKDGLAHESYLINPNRYAV